MRSARHDTHFPAPAAWPQHAFRAPGALRRGAALFGAAALFLGLLAQARAQEILGGGTLASPAVGPKPSFGLGGPGMVLVKNWHFGTNGTIKNYADMNANLFDAGWGHTQIGSVNRPLPASVFDGKYYEWNYSRVYLR